MRFLKLLNEFQKLLRTLIQFGNDFGEIEIRFYSVFVFTENLESDTKIF